MVHRCVICHSNSKNSDLSFHQFPKDNEKKEIWISILNIKQHIKDWHRICSLHFCQSSYTFCDKRKILRSNAVPISSNNLAMSTDISDVSSHIPPTINESFIEIDYDNDPSCHIPGCTKYNLLDNSTEITMPTDVSDVSSHTPPKINKRSFEAKNVITTPPTKKKFYSSSRIGDLDEDSFATHRRRKRSLTLVKNSVTNLRRKYKILKQRNSRLENKITTLNGIINELRSKYTSPLK